MLNIYSQGSRRKLLPPPSNMAKLSSYFNSAATLMTTQLQSLALHSLRDYTDLIHSSQVDEAVNRPSRINEQKSRLFLLWFCLFCLFYIIVAVGPRQGSAALHAASCPGGRRDEV